MVDDGGRLALRCWGNTCDATAGTSGRRLSGASVSTSGAADHRGHSGAGDFDLLRQSDLARLQIDSAEHRAGLWRFRSVRILFFLTSDIMPSSIGVQKIATVSQSFPLLAVPFFVLAGHLISESDITDRPFKFSNVAVSWIAGGLARVSIYLSSEVARATYRLPAKG